MNDTFLALVPQNWLLQLLRILGLLAFAMLFQDYF
jgi:hypothetical protein